MDHRVCCQLLLFLFPELDERVEQQLRVTHADRVSSWVQLETSREGRHWLPWRPNYDVGEASIEDCEDPDRVVVFDDLSAALFNVELMQDRFYLLCRFLDFVVKCLPTSKIEPPDLCLAEEWNTDSSLWWRVDEAFLDADSLSTFSDVELSKPRLDKFSTFVENVFSKCIDLFEADMQTALTLRYIRFKVTSVLLQSPTTDRRKQKHTEKELRHFFKSLLKLDHNRSNLAVWAQYARFEWEVGNYNDARKVFETALAMDSSANKAATENSEFPVIRLYSFYARLELGLDKLCSALGTCPAIRKATSDGSHNMQTTRAVRILTIAVNGYRANSSGVDISPAEIVRARHFYQRHLDSVHSSFLAVISSNTEQVRSHTESLLYWTTCFAVFQLLTTGLASASSVLQNFQTSVRKLCSVSTATDAVDLSTAGPELSFYHGALQSAAKLHVQLALYHSRGFSASLNVIRTALSDALAEFPNSVCFLKSFIDVELSSHFSGRLREYFHRAVNEANMPFPVLYAILAEKKRLQRLSTDGQAPCKSLGVRG